MNKQDTTKESQTDWTRIDAMTDDEIDLSDIPEITEEMWANAVWRKGGAKPASLRSQETLAVDGDVIEFFKAQGRDYQTKINELLRAYMEAQQAK